MVGKTAKCEPVNRGKPVWKYGSTVGTTLGLVPEQDNTQIWYHIKVGMLKKCQSIVGLI